MNLRLLGTSLLLNILAAGTVHGADVLLETQTSWDGGAIAYPPGKAQVTAVMLRIDPDKEPPFHCHPVPTTGYLLRGTVEVETENGDKILLEPGTALVEVMNTMHRGRAIGGPAEIVVFYAGAEGIPTTVLPGSDEAEQWPCGDGH